MKDIIIIGSGGTARDILSIINDINEESEQYNCAGILDDNSDLWGQRISDVVIHGPISEIVNYTSEFIVNSLGSPGNFTCRRDALVGYSIPDDRFESIIHPSVIISSSSNIGNGVVLYPNTVVMSGVTLGNQVISLSQTVFNHDVDVGNYSVVASGVNISGGVKVGSSCYLGAGCSIIQNVVIGNGALIGMGSVVLKDVDTGAVMAGNPAAVIRKQYQ